MKLTVGMIAREAFYKAQMLEKALVSKGILSEGEAKQLYNDELRKQAEARDNLRREFWDHLHEGQCIQLFPEMAKPVGGMLIAKSVAPFGTVCLLIQESGSYHKHYKKGETACFSDLVPSYILVQSAGGNFSGISDLD